MFDTNAASVRSVGVGIPEGQRTSRGEGVNTLQHFVPAQMFAVQYVDDQGVQHTGVVMLVGNQWYLPPNGEVWSQSLRPLSGGTWLGKQLTEAYQAQASPLPKADAVDILGALKEP